MRFRATRIKFIWGASKVIHARWRFGLWGFYDRVEGMPHSGLAISLRGVLLLGLLLSLLGYIGGSTAVYLWLDRRGHNYVTYTDVLLLPVRWDEVREKRGQAYLDEGIADMKAQRWAQGEMKLRIGLARYPQSLPPRLALAQFYFLTQRGPQALEVLRTGMDAVPGYPGRRYLNSYFAMALQGEDYASVLDACARYLAPGVELADKERDWLLQQKLNALLGDKQPGQALAVLESAPESVIFNEQRVLVLLELDRSAEAAAYLEQWRAQAGATAQILRLQVRAFRETRQPDKMDAALEELRRLQPADPRTLAYAVIQKHLAGRTAEARAAFDDYFFRFGGFSANLLIIAQPLAEIGELSMLQECVQRATEQGYDLRPYLLLLAQAQLKAGDWAGARVTTTRIGAMSTKGRTEQELNSAQLAGLLADTAANPGEAPQVALLKHVGTQLYPFRVYHMIVETLVRAGRFEAALEVAARAERRFPRNLGLAKFKEDATAALAAQREAQPKVELALSTQPLFVEAAFFSRVDEAMAGERWSEALALTREVQQARPLWLKTRETDVLTRQMRAAHGAHESLQMTLAARLLLDGTLARSQLVVDFAQDLHNRGETEAGVMLLREVIRKMSNHALARRLMEEWTTKPAPAAEEE